MLSLLNAADVLDQFSTNAPTQGTAAKSAAQPAPSASGPGRPHDDLLPAHLVPEGPQEGESEQDFIARLSAEMSKMFSQMPPDAAHGLQSPEDMAKMGKELEAFTTKMEEEGIKPEDLLKAILGEDKGSEIAEAAVQARDAGPSGSSSTAKNTTSPSKPTSSSSFDDTIRRTMNRLTESDSAATSATKSAAAKSEEDDMLAAMLKALESGDGGADSEGVGKMFTDMMHQLTHKDMLYEPMRELHEQYPDWLASNKPPKTAPAEYDRFSKQATIVKDIVTKFEDSSYRDEDEACRTYIWDKMQAMQELGAPPSALVSNPFGPGSELGEIPGLDAQTAEDSCPTQ